MSLSTNSVEEIIYIASKEILRNCLKNFFKENIYVDFLIKYPGICVDYISNPKLQSCVLGSSPNYKLAPCLTEKLTIWPTGTYDISILGNRWLTTNTSQIPEHEWQVFGDLKVTDQICDLSDQDALDQEILTAMSQVTFTEKHNQLRQKFNSIELKYDDIYKLWVPFLEERQNEIINDKYIKFFKQKLIKKFIDSNGSLIGLNAGLSGLIKNEIERIIDEDLRFNYDYYEMRIRYRNTEPPLKHLPIYEPGHTLGAIKHIDIILEPIQSNYQ